MLERKLLCIVLGGLFRGTESPRDLHHSSLSIIFNVKTVAHIFGAGATTIRKPPSGYYQVEAEL
jgi:hypothetical protein